MSHKPTVDFEKINALRTQHSHRTPDPETIKLLSEIRQQFLDLAVFIEVKLPPGREKALVHTKLDEARMWACNAAVSGGQISDSLEINIPVDVADKTVMVVHTVTPSKSVAPTGPRPFSHNVG